MEHPIWFDSWDTIIRTAVLSVSAYLCLIVILRLSGKRTLSKMNAFDFIVTIALGSTFATIIVSGTTTLAQGVTALVMLTGLQYVVAWLSVRSRMVERLVKAQPALLFYNGKMLHDAMRKERIMEDEIYAAMRASGTRDIAQVAAVVLEADGSMQVLPRKDTVQKDVLRESGVVPTEDR